MPTCIHICIHTHQKQQQQQQQQPPTPSAIRIEKKTAEAIDAEGWMHSGDKAKTSTLQGHEAMGFLGLLRIDV